MSFSITSNWNSAATVVTLSYHDRNRHNQLCWAAVDELADRLEASRKQGARAVVLASDHPDIWLGHAWLEDLLAGLEGREPTATGLGWFKAQEELSHPDWISIAAIDGDAAGGGAELGWACDIRVAAETAQFSQPEISMGLTTGIGGCSRLARLAGAAQTRDMVLSGEPVMATRLYQLGAVTQLAKPGEARDDALRLAEKLAGQSAPAVAGLKRVLAETLDQPLAAALAMEQETFQAVLAGDEARDGIRRRLADEDA